MIYSLILIALAAAANATMDTLAHHYENSIFAKLNSYYWNPGISWLNKYEFDDEWYGWIFKTILVWTTDGWHLFQMIMWASIVAAIMLYRPMMVWWGELLLIFVVKGLVFELFYQKVLVKTSKK